MTNFIYNMQDELFHLPLEDFSTIKKLVDHIEAQGKQLRELNMAIEKKNKTIEKYECEKKDLQERNSCLYKKVVELNNGIRNSEDLTWKQKYEALLHSSEQAIGALRKKCQEYKNAETDATTNTIETLTEANKKLEESKKRLMNRRGDLMRRCDELYMENEELKEKYDALEKSKSELLVERDALYNENNELKEEVNLYIGVTNTKNEEVEALAKAVRCPWGNNAEIISAKTACIKELKRQLEDEKEVSKDLNVIINSKNKLLDEYMTKCNNLEHNYKEEVRMKEQFKMTCFRYEVEVNKLKRDNAILSGKVKEISDLAESIVMLCDDEE